MSLDASFPVYASPRESSSGGLAATFVYGTAAAGILWTCLPTGVPRKWLLIAGDSNGIGLHISI